MRVSLGVQLVKLSSVYLLIAFVDPPHHKAMKKAKFIVYVYSFTWYVEYG